MKNPHQLANDNLKLSEEYSVYSGELAKLTKAEAEYYKAERPLHKSDTSVERAFQTTQDGINMTIIKLKLKTIEKKMSANKLMIEVAGNEARGLY